MTFEWDERKGIVNTQKHGITFTEAQEAFFDTKRVLISDSRHSINEERFFCLGRVGKGIATVRFTVRGDKIRIIGAGYWREGRMRYEKENNVR
jgi:uncharacterized DUF497 family protein